MPRDADMQEAGFGELLGDDEALQRGDLIFFKGHVGIMTDAENIVHATAHTMKVVHEPLADVLPRFEDDPAITARKRVR